MTGIVSDPSPILQKCVLPRFSIFERLFDLWGCTSAQFRGAFRCVDAKGVVCVQESQDEGPIPASHPWAPPGGWGVVPDRVPTSPGTQPHSVCHPCYPSRCGRRLRILPKYGHAHRIRQVRHHLRHGFRRQQHPGHRRPDVHLENHHALIKGDGGRARYRRSLPSPDAA